MDQLRRARLVGVPLVAISTPDPAATVRALAAVVEAQREQIDKLSGISGLAEADTPSSPLSCVIEWDVIGGLSHRDPMGQQIIATLCQSSGGDSTIGNPVAAVEIAAKLTPGAVLVIHQSNHWFSEAALAPSFIQGLRKLRDAFKRDHRMIVLLGHAVTLPPELQADVLSLDEELPDETQLSQIVRKLHNGSTITPDDDTIGRAVQAVRGLSSFAAEQAAALQFRKAGLDVPALWRQKVKTIEQTPGLKVFHGNESFDQIGGVTVIKDYLRRLIRGPRRPNVIVFIDEIEKMLGAGRESHATDKDQLGTILSYMQDHSAAGCIFVGPAGAAKSAVAKATGGEAGVLTIQLDLGAAKSRWNGQSEDQIRTALKVITAVGGDRSLWLATSNNITELPPELKRRFTRGTWFFDLPDAAERDVIWQLYLQRLPEGIEMTRPDDEGWTGADIKTCCEIAADLHTSDQSCSLREAAAFVVPICRIAPESIERLRTQASGRYLSASMPGVYLRSVEHTTSEVGRRVVLD